METTKTATPAKKGKTKKVKGSKTKSSTKAVKATKKKVNEKELDAKNKATQTKAVVSSRKLKYIYPVDCNDTLKRKAFRQEVRGKIRQFEKKLKEQLKGTERKAIKDELKAFESKVFA